MTFKNASGTRYLKALFYETTLADKATVVYTLKNDDHEGYPSLYRLYMAENDLTEYRFATKYLDGWDHWEMLCQCPWFQPHISRWRKELELRARSRALARLILLSEDSTGKEYYQANKYLLEARWKPAGESKRGRPTKEAIKQETQRIASLEAQLDADLERITPSKVN